MPDPSWQAMQQAQQAQQIHQNHVRHHRAAHDMARAHARHTGAPHTHRPLPHTGARGGGLRGLLVLIIIVGVVVYVAHDPELCTTVGNFARNLLAHVQSD
ncbi:hypothetical protein ABZ656_44050 [Streptomyces sp. NPDC007095]|uniref:hypothetical protein n=1 Tax=Streptomyces sp. NPDC007095 TaxID=3154482 RepID=UPI0033F96199